MKSSTLFLPVAGALWASALALGSAAPAHARSVPDRSIPPSVMMEVRVVENDFKAALASDCAPGKCFIKGCAYENHITLDQPRGTSLPGLPSEEGPGSVAPQDYLTRVRCEFTHESTVKTTDVQKLARRLEKRLSRGWMTVTVAPEALEPIPKSLAQGEPDEEEEAKKPEEEAAPPPEPVELTGDLALRQLWEQLLPHSPWMSAIFLLTLATLVLIWAGRRLGTPNLEEKMLEAQLQAGVGAAEPEEDEGEPEEVVAPPPDTTKDEEFAAEQERIWNERLDRVTSEDDDIIAHVLREWLRSGDYPSLARAMLVFGDRVTSAFEAVPELAMKKVEFASFLRDVDESALPSRARFFRDLNQHAMASLLLSHEDVHLYRALREDFGGGGVASLMKELPSRYAALLFALIDFDQQLEVAARLAPELRKAVVAELLASSRISLRESAYLAGCIEAVRDGKPLPAAPTGAAREHGPRLEVAQAVSALLPHVASADRQALFAAELQRQGGTPPAWYEDIVFSHMLAALPAEVRNDLLLEVDIRGLGAWLHIQPAEWRQAFIRELAGPLQAALGRNPAPQSHADLVRWARHGQRELKVALQGAYAKRGVRFVDLVG